jgi:hypothetical protein
VSQSFIVAGQFRKRIDSPPPFLTMTSSTRSSDIGLNSPRALSSQRERAGTVLIALSGAILLASALTKFLGVNVVVGQLEAFGFRGKVVSLGVLEAATAFLFLVPRTRFAGLLMFSAFLGGAVATHVQHASLPVPPAIVLALGWVGVWLRYRLPIGDLGAALQELKHGSMQTAIPLLGGFETEPSTGLERASMRVSQIVLALAAVLFFAIGAKYVFDPSGAAAAAGIAVASRVGITNMRAGVGGFSLGFAVIAAASVPRAKRSTMGRWFLVVVVGTVLLVRFIGATSDGSLAESRTVLIAEAVVTALGIGALALTRAGRRPARDV